MGTERRRSTSNALRRGALPRAIARGALVVACAASLALAGVRESAAISPEMPQPSYANTLYAFVNPYRLGTEQEIQESADALLGLVTPGPFARIGFADYHPIDMPWSADLLNPVLTRPSDAAISTLLARLAARGLTYHFSVVVGMSRAQTMYENAKRQDRRNAQWYLDNLIAAPGTPAANGARDAWVTPSRYARKLRRHMEVKVRAFAYFFLEKRLAYPNTLISASGDAEAELSEDRVNPSVGKNAQIIADYSPFAILEFRDWLLHIGLYGPGGPYDGQGYKKPRNQTFSQGVGADSPENLPAFNQAFKTSFTSWKLKYFHWSLDDKIDGDPNAIQFAKYKQPNFLPFPAGGKLVPGGFDAPRAPKDPHKKFWNLWIKFRKAMVKNFTRDVATWMTTTPGPNGATLSPDRWYSHQIPGNYLNGTQPGDPNPALRLQTSASGLGTANLPPARGSLGVTILDRFESAGFGPSGGYNRTSKYLIDAIEKMKLWNWGIPEFAPSWHIDVAPDPNPDNMKAQYHRAYGAGMHMFAYTPWLHLVGTANGPAMSGFISEVRDAPRTTSYVVARDAFARRLHLDLLKREPTGSELSRAVGGIADGTGPRPKLVTSMVASTEAQSRAGLIARYHLAFFGRAPTQSELSSRLTSLLSGGCNATECKLSTRQAIAASMAGTSEFLNRFGQNSSNELFVTRLYQLILGRNPGPGEASGWIGDIQNGKLSRSEAARQFAETAEYAIVSRNRVFVILTYLATLRRMPTAQEFDSWTSRRDGGLPEMAVAQVFLTSPEYLAQTF